MHIRLSIYDLDGETGEEIERAQEARDAITCRLPGLRMLLTGSLRSGLESWGKGRHLPGAEDAGPPGRAELLVFDSDVAAARALDSSVARELAECGHGPAGHAETLTAHGQAVIPFDMRRVGGKCRVSIAGLVFDPGFGSFELAEHHYVAEHSRLAARLPDCRGYLIGIVGDEQREGLQRGAPHRLAVAMFDTEQSLRQSLASPEAAELNRDAQGLTKVALLYFLDATIRM